MYGNRASPQIQCFNSSNELQSQQQTGLSSTKALFRNKNSSAPTTQQTLKRFVREESSVWPHQFGIWQQNTQAEKLESELSPTPYSNNTLKQQTPTSTFS
jgi:hypothetical protein